MKIIRWVLSLFILGFEKLYHPKTEKRDADVQAKIDLETQGLTLYQYAACPFCLKVRMAMKRQSLNIETRDAKRSQDAREELIAGAGKLKVPCLKIANENGKDTWMFESSDIISYLEQQFSKKNTA